MGDRPHAIEVKDVHKGFTVLGDRPTIWSRMGGSGKRRNRRLEVLRGISFDVEQGEFFGIVGRNGSGKSTLLKLLASVYGADRGEIRIAGRLAPFLELGVGFDLQQPARENVILNGVMMGLTPREAEHRCDAVIDFAGLREFTDMPLKNYSSGMKVRLAFAALTEVDADILLLDEVLAVGDAEFQEKCAMVFERLKAQGVTIVLVTHSMATVNNECDRAMLIHEGEIDRIGRPFEVSNRYIEINMRAAATVNEEMAAYATRFADVIADPPIRIVDAWIHGFEDSEEARIPEREPIEVRVVAEVLREVEGPGFQFRIDDDTGRALFAGGAPDLGLEGDAAKPGERLEVGVSIENRFAAGRYTFAGGMAQRMPDGTSEPATPVSALRFEVAGDQAGHLLSLDHEVTLSRVESGGSSA